MIEALDEVSEIPFEVFWDKFNEERPGDYDKIYTQGIWLKTREANRIIAFNYLCRFGTDYRAPHIHLEAFDLPF
jgi:hypothetical protein